jgi:small neutral amino acid transporter SnatA (MarC family)
MIKNIGSAILGYIVIFATIFITFTIAYLILGTEGAFQERTYDVSFAWIVVSIILSIFAAVLGGFVCKLVAKNDTAVKILAGIVLVLGLSMAVVQMTADTSDRPVVRDETVESMDAMNNAISPTWMNFLNPLLGVLGVMYGGRLKKSE